MKEHVFLDDYLPEREGLRLEFKAAEAIADKRILPRAVCGFLNSEGGEVVVGLRELEGGLAPDPFDDFEGAHRTVWDRLVSSIEPVHDLARSIEIERLSCRTGGCGMRIRVLAPGDAPLHIVKEKRGSFAAFRRVGDRLVPIGWSEIQERMGLEASGPDQRAQTKEALESWRKEVESDSLGIRGKGGLFMAFRLEGERLSSADKALLGEVSTWVRDPTKIGIRRNSCHYSSLACPERHGKKKHGWYRSGDALTGVRMLEYSKHFECLFATRLEGEILRPRQSLGEFFGHRRYFPNAVVAHRPIWPRPLLETIASCSRFQAAFLRPKVGSGSSSTPTRIWAALLLTGTKHARMGHPWIGDPDRDPRSGSFDEAYPHPETPVHIASMPAGEFAEAPDRMAHILAMQLYDDFLTAEAEVPFYDAGRGEFDFQRDR